MFREWTKAVEPKEEYRSARLCRAQKNSPKVYVCLRPGATTSLECLQNRIYCIIFVRVYAFVYMCVYVSGGSFYFSSVFPWERAPYASRTHTNHTNNELSILITGENSCWSTVVCNHWDGPGAGPRLTGRSNDNECNVTAGIPWSVAIYRIPVLPVYDGLPAPFFSNAYNRRRHVRFLLAASHPPPPTHLQRSDYNRPKFAFVLFIVFWRIHAPHGLQNNKMASGVSTRSVSMFIPSIPQTSQFPCYVSDPVHICEQLPGVQGADCGPVQWSWRQGRPGFRIRRHQQTGKLPEEVPPRKGTVVSSTTLLHSLSAVKRHINQSVLFRRYPHSNRTRKNIWPKAMQSPISVSNI